MRRAGVVISAMVVLTVRAAAEPAPERGYVAVGAGAGLTGTSDPSRGHLYTELAMVADVGVKLGHGPLWAHGELALGRSNAAGDLVYDRVGLFARVAVGVDAIAQLRHVRVLGGLGVGYGANDSDALDTYGVLSARVGFEVGGRRLAFRALGDVVWFPGVVDGGDMVAQLVTHF